MKTNHFPKPIRRFVLQENTHDENIDLFRNLSNSVLPNGFRYHLGLEFQGMVVIDNGQAAVVPPDALAALLKNVNVNIAGIQEQRNLFSGVQWAYLQKARGVRGNTQYSFSPNNDLILSDGEEYPVLFHLPLYLPDPFSDGYERCGLLGGHFRDELFTCKISTGNNADVMAWLGLDGTIAVSGVWRLVAYALRGSSIIIQPKQIFTYKNVLVQGVSYVPDTEALRLLTAIRKYDTNKSTGVPETANIPIAERDILVLDGVLVVDEKDTNLDNAITQAEYDPFRYAYYRNQASPLIAGETVLAGVNPTAFPLGWDGVSTTIDTFTILDNRNNLGDATFVKKSLKYEPQSARVVYQETARWHCQEELAFAEAALGMRVGAWSKIGMNRSESPWGGDRDKTIMPLIAKSM